jgi:hypothetical protein
MDCSTLCNNHTNTHQMQQLVIIKTCIAATQRMVDWGALEGHCMN